MGSSPTILLFDSGLGGLTVHREVVKARPDARLIYAADDAGFPYGPRAEPELVERVLAVMADLLGRLDARSGGGRLQHRFDAGAAAASRALSRCRSWAPCRRSSRPAPHRKSKLVSVLGTEATVAARIHPRADPRFRPGLRGDACRLAASSRCWRRPSSTASRPRMPKSHARSRPALSRQTVPAPISWCWPAPTTPCCWTGSGGWHPGRSLSSTRPRPSPAGWSSFWGPWWRGAGRPRPYGVHLGPPAIAGPESRSGALRALAKPCPPAFDLTSGLPLKTAHLAGLLARVVFRDPWFSAGASVQSLSVPASPGTEEGAILNL